MKQLTVVSEDKVGLLADISYILGKARINIDSLSVASMDGNAVLTFLVKDEKRARDLLRANHYKVLEFEVIVIKIKDEPGMLSTVSSALAKQKISIINLYVLAKGGGYSIVAMEVDKPKSAKKILAPYLDIER